MKFCVIKLFDLPQRNFCLPPILLLSVSSSFVAAFILYICKEIPPCFLPPTTFQHHLLASFLQQQPEMMLFDVFLLLICCAFSLLCRLSSSSSVRASLYPLLCTCLCDKSSINYPHTHICMLAIDSMSLPEIGIRKTHIDPKSVRGHRV